MTFFRLGDVLLNMNNVDFIERDYMEAEGLYRINIAFASGATCNNGFPTKEEAEKLFIDLLCALNTIDIRVEN